MEALSAVKFFSEAFDWFAKISSKLPKIDFKTYFIVVVALLIGVGLIVALTFFGTYRFKLTRACRRIIRYLAGVEFIDDDNVSDFTAQCFSAKAPSLLRDSWVQYLGVRFGYPSDIVSEQNVYDKEVKRVREIRANVYIAIALVLIAIFSFWGYGTLDGKDMGVIFLASLLLSGVIYLVLVILNRIQTKNCLNALSEMQEDLDAKVILQVEKSFATDSSPLADMAAIVDEIIARNTAKDIGFEDGNAETPIEQLIAQSVSTQTSQPEQPVPDFEDEMMQEDFDGLQIQDKLDAEAAREEARANADTESEQTETPEDERSGETIEAAEEAEQTPDEATDETVEQETDEPDAIDGEIEEDVGAIDGEVEDTVEDNAATDESAEEAQDEEAVEEEAPAEDISEILEERALTVAEDPLNESEDEVASEENSEENEEDLAEEDNPQDNEKQETEDNESVAEEPRVIVVEDAVEDEETVKPAKLVKLPNLVDYLLQIKPSRKVTIQFATLLINAYSKFKDSEEDRKIVIECMKKVMLALQSNN